MDGTTSKSTHVSDAGAKNTAIDYLLEWNSDSACLDRRKELL